MNNLNIELLKALQCSCCFDYMKGVIYICFTGKNKKNSLKLHLVTVLQDTVFAIPAGTRTTPVSSASTPSPTPETTLWKVYVDWSNTRAKTMDARNTSSWRNWKSIVSFAITGVTAATWTNNVPGKGGGTS
jgi:hypothetical protein